MVDRKPEGDKEEDGFHNIIEYEDDVNKPDVNVRLLPHPGHQDL